MTLNDQPHASPSPLRRIGLSTTQLIASALAAVTATVAASYLGVSGTVIGAAVASVLSVLGNAVYTHSLRHTGNRMRAAVPARGRWVLGACATVFVAVLAVVTVVELAAGRPLTDLVRGTPGSGTTVFGGPARPQAHGVPRPATSPAPQPTVTITAKVVTVTPTVTVRAAAVTSTAPAPSGAPTSSAAPTTPSPTPSSPPAPSSSLP